MIRNTRKGYKALALALLVFTASVTSSCYKIYLEYGRITKKFLPSLWAAAQAEIELLRLLDVLNGYVREDTPVDSNQLVERFYILWSRVPLLLIGSESEHVRAAEGAVQVIEDLGKTLKTLEQDVLSLQKGDYVSYYKIHNTLTKYTTTMHKITARTMLKDEEVAEAQREDIRHLYWELSGYFLAIIASAVVLVALLFKEFRNVGGLLRIANAAEATASAARAQLTAVIDAVPARIAARDSHGRYIFRNKYSVDRAPGPGPDDTDARAAEDELDRSVFKSGEVIPLFEQEESDQQHGIHTWLTTKVPLKVAAGKITGVVTVSLDITQQKEAQRLNTLLATALEHAGDVIEITDAESRFEYVNAAFERISGFGRLEAIGQTSLSLLISDQSEEPHYRAVQSAIATGKVWQGTLTGRRKDGSLYQQEATISPVRNARDEITHYVAVKRDITERLQSQARIWHLAHHDALTDLPNRVLFQDRLQQAVAHGRRTGLLVAILFIDLDNFKDVNDAFGHEFGDHLLMAVTERLCRCTRETDTVARLGGDEFAVIQTDLGRSEAAAKLAEKILEQLSMPFSLEGQEIHMSASIGVTVCPLDQDDPHQLVKNADMAMYRAKNTGRANYQFYKQDMNLAFQARKELERDLRKALANGELDLYYQPQIDARRDAITGAEALLRWPHPDRGFIPPAEFVPIAEECGLIVPLGEWVLETACRQNKIWQDLGLPRVRVAVNLSTVQFLYRDLMASVIRALDTSGLDHSYLELEITEGILMRETEVTISTLRRLTELGIQIAVDDFGTGYSSMAYLKRFPVNKIKIDRAFVTDVTTDRGDAAIVSAVIGLAHGLGLTVAAEGVETLEQAAHLRARGCDELQGFYFGRPVPAHEFEQRLREITAARSTSAADARAHAHGLLLASTLD
jgi:diguanylate cyclase (GGDEF)-like protein/PAS domain S-box-containing protein